ncbi:hypothetical protein BJV77DRAFT_1024884 [Russula vinacea]|nr:hypothetical protein BJV77DRAFT_1024884 [Russula vinacea]
MWPRNGDAAVFCLFLFAFCMPVTWTHIMMLDVTQCANHCPGRDTGSWLDIGHETKTITCYPRGEERQHRTGQQNNLGGSRYRVRASVTVIGGPRARHAAPSWYSELRWIPHESKKNRQCYDYSHWPTVLYSTAGW